MFCWALMQVSAFHELDPAFLSAFRRKGRRLAAGKAPWCHHECNHRWAEMVDPASSAAVGCADSLAIPRAGARVDPDGGQKDQRARIRDLRVAPVIPEHR